ncbi:uncharacterized protein MKK02DRAFT_44562 [Dioszegia hungarica]|uniref:Asl1-like glycosyl hydrolase catalytic domain-containing protein n=1 Tax=Dioszegia hungarica TaxID=4972 RepID=A0AA38LVV9_9TREE|nr:uncharacterized protein MKK02DRAFT_44562 [Dioszegia hungarica]KAI9635866.1 hypothetical protein MKK02DRAFT_44562 [Dioszegia hungarica]
MSGKAGISWPVQELTSDPVAKFFQPGSKLSWHYNWNKNWSELLPDTTPGLKIDAEFVPMLWKPDFLHNADKLQEGWSMLLGYNEPDHNDPSVASRCSAVDAARSWKEVAKLRRQDPAIKLVSPAVASDKGWLKDFFSCLEPDEMPDILAIHIYTTTFDSFRASAEEYYSMFRLPIMITEFAVQSFSRNVPGPQSQQQVHDFMGQTTKWLDETGYIMRYCWFGAVRDPSNLHGVHPYNRLMDEQGNVTPLGHQYIAGGHD